MGAGELNLQKGILEGGVEEKTKVVEVLDRVADGEMKVFGGLRQKWEIILGRQLHQILVDISIGGEELEVNLGK